MLKPQDIAVVLHIVNLGPDNWTQQQVAYELGMSQSEVSQAIKRLIKCKLMNIAMDNQPPAPHLRNLEEFLVHGFQYTFPAEIGGITRGIPTAYAADIFKKKISQGDESPPVWPHAEGTARGYALKPLYKSLPTAITKFNLLKLHEILALLDALRHGRVRERKIAIDLIQKYFKEAKHDNSSATKS